MIDIIVILEYDIDNLINITNTAIDIFYKKSIEIYNPLTYTYDIKRYLFFTSTDKNIDEINEYFIINNINSKYLLIEKIKNIFNDNIENILLNLKMLLLKKFTTIPNIIICVSKKNFLKCQLFTKIMFSEYDVKIISE
jgi:hypothetical protein